MYNKKIYFCLSALFLLMLIIPVSFGVVSLTNVSYHKFDNDLEDVFFNVGALTSFVKSATYNTTNLSTTPSLVIKDNTHYYEIDNITAGHISNIRTIDFWIEETEVSSNEYYFGFGKEPTDQNLFRILNIGVNHQAIMVKSNTVIWSITTSGTKCGIEQGHRKNIVVLLESNTTASIYVDTEFCGRTTIGGNALPDGDWDHIILNGRLDHASGVMGAYEIDNLILSENVYTGDDINTTYNGGLGLELGLPVSIINSSWNVTFNPFINAITTNWNTGGQVNFSFPVVSDAVLTLSVDTNLASNMSCSLTEGNYSEMITDPLRKSATTDTTEHSYTLSDNFTVEGQQCVYCSFIGDGHLMETTAGVSQSGCLDVYINTKPVNATLSTPLTGNAVSGIVNVNWLPFTDANLILYEVLVNGSISNETFIGNTTNATTNLNYNFSLLNIGENYSVIVKGYDSYGSTGKSFNQFVTVVAFSEQQINYNLSLVTFPNGSLNTQSPFVFNISVSGAGSLNFSGDCGLYINDSKLATITPLTVGNHAFPAIVLLSGNYTFNSSCDTGNDATNSLQYFWIGQKPPANITTQNIFAFNNCPTTTPEVLLYVFFACLFGLMILIGLTFLPIIGMFGSIGGIFIVATMYSCIGAVLSLILMLALLVTMILIANKY